MKYSFSISNASLRQIAIGITFCTSAGIYLLFSSKDFYSKLSTTYTDASGNLNSAGKAPNIVSSNFPLYDTNAVIPPRKKIFVLKSELPKGSVNKKFAIIEEANLPAMEYGMVNVTKGFAGLRLSETNGYSSPIEIEIDLAKIPQGYNINDVQTFWFDKVSNHWLQLKRDSIDYSRKIIYSSVNKDGDYINAIIQVPDLPETQGYMPTTINDLKVGDPASMIPMISQPVANSQGTATLNFHIETPRGRRGIEPDINLNYSSDADDGILGQGWSLGGFSTITLDTRRGSPTYNNVEETETYLLDGQMLAYSDYKKGRTASFFEGIKRADVTQIGRTMFAPRRQNDFDKIERLGNKADNYTWVITKKNGGKYFYGTDGNMTVESAILRKSFQSREGIAEWKLVKVVDIYGNTMTFSYSKKTQNGSWIYPEEVNYTLHQTIPNLSSYRIKLIYDDTPRADNSIYNSRTGLTLNQNQQRLASILVFRVKNALAQLEKIRKYEFEYKEGGFKKLVLKKISQYGDNDQLFNYQELGYYNEDQDQPYFSDFKKVTVSSQGLSAGIKDPLGIVTNEPTAIGGSKSSNNSGSMYVGVGPGYDVWSVNNSVGIQFNNSSSSSSGLNTLVDIDGDGRPDQIFSNNGAIGYYKNISLEDSIKFAQNATFLSGAPVEFLEENSRTTGWGARANFFVSAGFDHASTESSTKTFFSDVNGDGLMDIVSNGAVYFNTGKIKTNRLQFSTLSSETPLPINGSGSISSSFVYDNSGNKEMINNNPLQEAVKVWEAPYNGKVKIESIVKLQSFKVKNENADGVWVSIESRHPQLNKNDSISKDDTSKHKIETEIPVSKGDKIFFRLQSGRVDDANGSDDKAEWEQKITYIDGRHLAVDTVFQNPLLNRVIFNSKQNYLLSNTTAVAIPDSVSALNLFGEFVKKKTMDSVLVQIVELFLDRANPIRDGNGNVIKNTKGDTVFNYSFGKIIDSKIFGGDQQQNGIMLTMPNVQEIKDKKYQFQIRSHTNIDLEGITWKPVISYKKIIHLKKYTSGNNWESVDSTVRDTMYIVPTYIFNDLNKFGPAVFESLNSNLDTVVKFYPQLTQSVKIDSSFWFTVKSPFKVLGKKLLTYRNGILADTIPLSVSIPKGVSYIASFESQENALGKIKTEKYQSICNSILDARYYFKTPNLKGFFGKREIAALHISDFLSTISSTGRYFIIPDLNVGQDSSEGNIIVQVWKNGNRIDLGNQDSIIKAKNGHFEYPLNYISVDLAKDDKVSVLFIYPFDTLSNNPTLKREYSLTKSFEADFWINRSANDQIFGPLYKGWGQFVYNGMNGRHSLPIKTNELKLPEASSVSETDISNFNSALASANRDTIPIASRDPIFDKFSSANIVFTPMIPFANANMRTWLGNEDSIYISDKIMSTSRLGIDNVKSIDPFKLATITTTTTDKSYGRGIVKISTSTSDSYSAGADFLTGSYSTTTTNQVSDFIDLNGDRFPDVVNGANVQFTNTIGKLNLVRGNTFIHSSKSSGGGVTISGGNGTKTPTAPPPNPNKASTASISNVNNAKAVDESAGSFTGASGAYNASNDYIDFTWLDINGDGLPDKVYKTNYELNLGYQEFDVKRSLSLDIFKSSQKTLSPGVTAGFSFDKKSFSGGAGLSFSNGRNESVLQDMNGDGLQDKVTVNEQGDVKVEINSGKDFFRVGGNWTNLSKGGNDFGSLGDVASLPVRFLPGAIVTGWKDMERTKFSSSNGVSFGGSATFGFTAAFLPIKFVFNPSFNHSNGLGRTIRQIIDVNADGFPDIVYSNSQGAMEVMVSLLGKTNKLTVVKNPLGGSYKIDYNHVDVTTENPGGKWVMSELSIDDKVKKDRIDTTKTFDSKKKFTYSGGKYDRFEREFLGFANVITKDINFDGSSYRNIIVSYDTSYYRMGSMLEELVGNGIDTSKKYTYTKNEYHSYSLASEVSSVGGFKREVGIMFSPLKSTTDGTYEGFDQLLWKNVSSYVYNRQYGYVEKFSYKELNETLIDYETVIKYQNDIGNYVVGLPIDVLTKSKTGQILRHIGAEYYDWAGELLVSDRIGQKLALKKVLNYLDDTRKTTTELRYVNDDFGNVTLKILPNGLTYQYEYDGNPALSATHSYLKEIKNLTFNFASKTDYDYKYGIPIKTTDINENQVNYQLDHFGRIIRIIGPKECENPDGTDGCRTEAKYTIKIDYGFKDGSTPASLPLTATVTHFDQEFNRGIQTINFVDGFDRSIQIKKTAAIFKTDATLDLTVKWIVSGRINYDAFGRAIETYYPGTDESIDGLTFIDNLTSPYFTDSKFDLLDRKIKTVLPDGKTFDSTVYSKDKKFTVATIFSPNDSKTSGGIQKQQVFTNGSDLKAKEILFDNADTAISTVFNYDPIHQLIKVINSRNTQTNYQYDHSGNKKEIYHPDGGTTKFIYDDSGRLSDKITAVGDTISYKYDHNRAERILYNRHPENNVLYVYSNNRRVKLPGEAAARDINACNRIVYQEDASGSQAFEYGSLGEITKTTRTVISPFSSTVNTFITQFEYDTWNRIRNIIYPDKEKVEYKYNPAGLLASVTGHRDPSFTAAELPGDQKNYPYVKAITYDEFEQRTSLTYGNGTITKYTYENDRRRLQNLNISGIKSPSVFANNFNEAFSYDNQNNIVQNVISTNNNLFGSLKNTERFFYDRLNRLDSAHGSWSNTNQTASYDLGMDYDGVFNIIGKRLSLESKKAAASAHIDYTNQYLYNNAATHQLTQLNVEIHRNTDAAYTEFNREKYDYDRNGNNIIKAPGDNTGTENVFRRKIDWDEENRINAVSMNGYVSHYVYDANGDRTIKLSTENDGAYANGKFAGDTSVPATFSLYANPYFSMRNGNSIYTKHIYIGTQRIISQVENIKAFKVPDISFPEKMPVAVCPYQICANSNSIDAKRKLLNDRMNADFEKLDLKYEQIKANAFDIPNSYEYKKAINPVAIDIGKEPMPDKNKPQLLNYFYHNNLVGSTSFITDDAAKVVQYVAYLPFGETFMELRQNYSSQFLFNSKEQDQETGLYYYGARYYDPHTYQWLGVDPMAEKYGSISPYNYCLNNPLLYKEESGLTPNPIIVQTHQVLYTESYHASIRITPTNQNHWKTDSRFSKDPISGSYYATIGAGMNHDAWGNGLKSGLNRQNDKDLYGHPKVDLAPVDLKGRNEDQVINSLFEGESIYRSGEMLNYDIDPGENSLFYKGSGYNSNSFVSGLLQAIGLPVPKLETNTPGYNKPIPKENLTNKCTIPD